MLDDGPPGVDPEGPDTGNGDQDQGKPEDMVVQEGEDPSQAGGPEGLMRQREQEEVRTDIEVSIFRYISISPALHQET